MASKPGILTDWPWKSIGAFKYMILAPWVAHSTYSFMVKPEAERDLGNFLIFPLLLVRIVHNQIWISLSRYQTATGKRRILDKGIDFEQIDRESNWDDQIVMTAFILYVLGMVLPAAAHLPLWRTDGIILTAMLHVGPVEFLYYWTHRALHHHYLYSRYHSHHHSSIVTQPISSVIHPFAEIMVYILLFTIPMMTSVLSGTASIAAIAGYLLYIDVMNNMGHCNFEFVPTWLFSIFPPLKYFMYTPSFHSLHHTQFRTNYSLFMPIYDYIYNTMDKSSDLVHETSLKKPLETADVVHLTHLTTPESICHLQLTYACQTSKWSLWFSWPVTCLLKALAWLYGPALVVEANRFKKVVAQIWVIPKFEKQYLSREKSGAVNKSIEKAIVDANGRGTKVLSFGLLNQGEELNRNGELYVEKHPQMQMKVVDGSSLVVAVVLNYIRQGTTQVLLRGSLTKVAYAIASHLTQRGIKIGVLQEEEYNKLRLHKGCSPNHMFLITKPCDQKIWVVGDELTEEDQLKAPKETLFIPFMQFPPKRVRKDCFYSFTPSMVAPKSLENLYSCEDWLPRRVMSAWRIAGIVHALEEWNVNECGNTMFDIDKVWQAALQHGFQPLHLDLDPHQWSIN